MRDSACCRLAGVRGIAVRGHLRERPFGDGGAASPRRGLRAGLEPARALASRLPLPFRLRLAVTIAAVAILAPVALLALDLVQGLVLPTLAILVVLVAAAASMGVVAARWLVGPVAVRPPSAGAPKRCARTRSGTSPPCVARTTASGTGPSAPTRSIARPAGVRSPVPSGARGRRRRDADVAMYRAKELGHARHVVFDASLHGRALALLELESDL